MATNPKPSVIGGAEISRPPFKPNLVALIYYLFSETIFVMNSSSGISETCSPLRALRLTVLPSASHRQGLPYMRGEVCDVF